MRFVAGTNDFVGGGVVGVGTRASQGAGVAHSHGQCVERFLGMQLGINCQLPLVANLISVVLGTVTASRRAHDRGGRVGRPQPRREALFHSKSFVRS